MPTQSTRLQQPVRQQHYQPPPPPPTLRETVDNIDMGLLELSDRVKALDAKIDKIMQYLNAKENNTQLLNVTTGNLLQ
jgi:hypothetical protein